MRELGVETGELAVQVANNRHTHLTATYYLLLQQWLRQKNESVVGYYAAKDALINRHRVVERVKEMYERRLNTRLEQLARSRDRNRQEARSQEKKRCKTSEKKRAAVGSGSKWQSRELYLSPEKRKKIDFRHSSSKSHKGSRKKKLSRA
jgi:hypothetical protein